MNEQLIREVENEIKEVFINIETICEKNSLKVLNAFQNNNLSYTHFNGTTGYGYGDTGRDIIEKIYSEVLKAEDSLVRTQMISGTHAISTVLFAILRPGDTVISINGKPYDTLDSVIGIEENKSSLKSFGVKYEQIDLIDNKFNTEEIIKRISKKDIKLIMIQRSCGYSSRKSFSINDIEKIISKIRSVNNEVYIMVDNCYGEFVEEKEPLEAGADIIVGSLIKNLGGGIVPSGAYIAGKKELVNLSAERLTSPRIRKRSWTKSSE